MKRGPLHRKPVRRGVVLVAAMACLMVALSIVATMLAGTLRSRLQGRSERDARQTALLVVAGRDLARARLAEDAAYEGETWSPPVTDSPFARSAQVEITVSSSGDRLDRVEVTATYPFGEPRPVRRSQVFYVPSAPTSPEE